jgi:hypothetical protein
MPFDSKSQEKWAFANKKPWAKEWASKTSQKSLPEKVNNNKMNKKAIIKKAIKGRDGKGGPFDTLKNTVGSAMSGAMQGAKNQFNQGVQQTSKFDPSNYIKAGEGALAGGIVGGVGALKNAIQKAPVMPKSIPTPKQGSVKAAPMNKANPAPSTRNQPEPQTPSPAEMAKRFKKAGSLSKPL